MHNYLAVKLDKTESKVGTIKSNTTKRIAIELDYTDWD